MNAVEMYGKFLDLLRLHHLHLCSDDEAECFPDYYGRCQVEGRCNECEQCHPCHTRQLIVGVP